MLLFKAGAPIVLFGDFNRTSCVHGSIDIINGLPSIHVAEPRLAVVPELQPAGEIPDPQAEMWGLVRALLEKAKQERGLTGGVCLVCLVCLKFPAILH